MENNKKELAKLALAALLLASTLPAAGNANEVESQGILLAGGCNGGAGGSWGTASCNAASCNAASCNAAGCNATGNGPNSAPGMGSRTFGNPNQNPNQNPNMNQNNPYNRPDSHYNTYDPSGNRTPGSNYSGYNTTGYNNPNQFLTENDNQPPQTPPRGNKQPSKENTANTPNRGTPKGTTPGSWQ